MELAEYVLDDWTIMSSQHQHRWQQWHEEPIISSSIVWTARSVPTSCSSDEMNNHMSSFTETTSTCKILDNNWYELSICRFISMKHIFKATQIFITDYESSIRSSTAKISSVNTPAGSSSQTILTQIEGFIAVV